MTTSPAAKWSASSLGLKLSDNLEEAEKKRKQRAQDDAEALAERLRKRRRIRWKNQDDVYIFEKYASTPPSPPLPPVTIIGEDFSFFSNEILEEDSSSSSSPSPPPSPSDEEREALTMIHTAKNRYSSMEPPWSSGSDEHASEKLYTAKRTTDDAA